MARTTDYINYPEFMKNVQDAPTDADWTTLLKPGDLVLARSEGNAIAELIQRTDGFFTHTTVYIGEIDGVGWVAHAHTTGVQCWDLDQLNSFYPAGLAWARPGYGETVNAAAAQWAKKWAKPADADNLLPYGYENLGVCFAVMVRAMWRRANKDTEEITDADIAEMFDRADEEFKGRDEDEFESSSCSSYAWRSYHRGTGRLLMPELIDGVRNDDGVLKLDGPPEVELVARENQLKKQISKKWTTFTKMLHALPGAATLLMPNKGGLLDEIVTPGDLWCSPSMTERGWLVVPSANEHDDDERGEVGDPE